jgi:hypothetical protein
LDGDADTVNRRLFGNSHGLVLGVRGSAPSAMSSGERYEVGALLPPKPKPPSLVEDG